MRLGPEAGRPAASDPDVHRAGSSRKGGLPTELTKLQQLLARGLRATAPLWIEVRVAYGWVHRAAHLLGNPEGQSVPELRRAYRRLRAEMCRDRETAGALASAVSSFLKVTKSHWLGLFHCYAVADLPPTNHELEQYFGSVRYQERRCSGRRGAAPGLVVRGSVRIVASLGTIVHRYSGAELQPTDLTQWCALRQELAYRQEGRRAQRRFRRDPNAYLARLEAALLKSTLPP